MKMSDSPVAMITISSSENEDVQVVQTESKNTETNSHGGASTVKKVPLQRIITGKDVFSEFVQKYKSTTKDKLEEMEKISKKLWKRFNEASPDYTKSKSFKDYILKATEDFKNEFAHRQIVAVCDELRNHKKTPVKSNAKDSASSTSVAASASNSELELDPKTVLHLKKLEKILAKLHYRIQKLESNEVDLNSSDEENSAYLQVDKYKNRFCQVYKKICEIKKKDSHAERAYKKFIKFNGTTIPEVNKAIEKFYNSQREFPDYRDILTVVNKANEVKHLNLTAAEMDGMALKAFRELGKTLKKYRVYDDVEIFRSYFSNEEDPASQDEQLKNSLEENRKKYGSRIDEIIDKYAVMQEEEHLEPTEFDSNAEDEQDDEEDEGSASDNASPASIMGSRSHSEESCDDFEKENDVPKCEVALTDPKCQVVLTDVKLTPAWEQYVVRKQNTQLVDIESDSNDDSAMIIDTCSPPRSSRKRSLEKESSGSDSNEDVIYSEEPIPSTSQQCVPITLGNYRHIKRSKVEEQDNTVQVDDSDEKSAKTSPKKKDDLKTDNFTSSKINSLPSAEKKSQKKLTDSKSRTDDIIEIDNDDLKKKTPSVEAKTSTSEQQEDNAVDIQNHFLCNGDPLPLEVVLDDATDQSKSEAIKSQSGSPKSDSNDEIVFVGEVVKSKSPSKGDNVVDIVEISDSPEKSKQIVPKSFSQPLNLSQFIRNMKFGTGSAPKSGITASSSKQVSTSRNTFPQINRSNRGKNPFQNFRQTGSNAVSTMSRTTNNFSMAQSVNPFINQRQTSSNNRQFASNMQSRNISNMQYVGNNVNMKQAQAAVQRQHVSQRTVRVFDANTNRVVTRKEITTVFQQSVTHVMSQNQRHVVGQNQRIVNHRQVQQVHRQQRVAINRNNNSEDVITLE